MLLEEGVCYDQHILELTPKKDVLFIIGDWNAKVGSQETPGVTGKFGLGIWNEAGQRLIVFCQENAPNIGIPQYVRQILSDIKKEINSNTIIVGDFIRKRYYFKLVL